MIKNFIFRMFTVIYLPNKNKRLDKCLSINFPKYSRTFLKKCVLNGKVYVNGTISSKPKKKFF